MEQPERPHRRRPRYSGKHPRRFEEKYKERSPELYPETISKVIASGKTPAGAHRPIMVKEILSALGPTPGDFAIDCTLGYGGHASAILAKIQPGGRLIGLDVDPFEQPKTEQRLRSQGFSPETFSVRLSNFAGIHKVVAETGPADLILADLGVSSMQLDDPHRGFSLKLEGPLDMRMNPGRGQPASALLKRIGPAELAALLEENSDEPQARLLAPLLAGKSFDTTTALAQKIRSALPTRLPEDEQEKCVRRVFQSLRIAVNNEFASLDSLLRVLPGCLKPGGRVAILTFHSGEDRRVKKAFSAGYREGVYSRISGEVIRPSAQERNSNPRSAPAKLRWAVRGAAL
jgi:16S rRNA (cytosine1402-N4)-methyltransferase